MAQAGKRTRMPAAAAKSRALGHDAIAAILGAEILSGRRKPGHRLPSEAEMHKRFGVSRMVLREVSKTLAAKGMVTFKARVGTLVTEAASWNWLDPDVLSWRMSLGLDDALLKQVGEVRAMMEPAAAMLAAQRASKTQIATILAATRAMQAAAGDRQRFSQADYAFHAAVAAASGNPLLCSLTAIVDVVMAAFLAVVPVSPPALSAFHRSILLHVKVADAIAARSPLRARRAMEKVVSMGNRDIANYRVAGRRVRARA